jgi:glycosyltransferase involved in cell wall biosynthesis
MKNEKLLTIAVPAYNAEKTLSRCLDSVIQSPALPMLDIIAINDGSSDSTGEIMEVYAGRFPESFQLIHKENGGHGSGINAAIGIARGKYFKVLDADDALVTGNLAAFIDILKTASADTIITSFRVLREDGSVIREIPIIGVEPNREYSFSDFWKAGKGVRSCCVFHGLFYRTDFYLSCGIKLSEHIFYEDQEYATIPFRELRTVQPVNIVLYEYFMGGEQQSVSDANQVKNLSHLEKVFWVLWEAYRTLPQTGNEGDTAVRDYFRYKMVERLLSYYAGALLRNSDQKAGREQARFLHEQLKSQDKEFSRYTTKQYLLLFALHFVGFSRAWNLVRRLPCYRVLAQLAYQ